MASNMHNTRLIRFLIVLTIVVLTIFIYTSYSSTQSLSPPPMRSASALIGYSPLNNRTNSGGGSTLNELDSSAANSDANKPLIENSIDAAHKSFMYNSNLPHSSLGNEMVFIKKLIHHREPTIDVNPSDDDGEGGDGAGGGVGGGGVGGVGGGGGGGGGGGAAADGLAGDGKDENIAEDTALDRFSNNNNDLMQEEQYVQSLDNSLGYINNTIISAGGGGLGASGTGSEINQQIKQQPQSIIDTNNINNLNKIPESDVLIPTSNLQKFIESADKILKNITIPQASAAAPAEINNKSPDTDGVPKPLLAEAGNDENNLIEDDDRDEALPPSVIMKIKAGASPVVGADTNNEAKNAAAPPNLPKVTSTTKKVAKVAADPAQGIPTHQIYESGHMNEEIDTNQICPNEGENLKLLILITSAPTHTEARLAIRQTWGHFGTRRDVSTAFILGRTPNATINTALTQENMIYGDLIRGHFLDSYNNLTLKTLSFLEWVDKYCIKTKYILKTDDDMFINVPKLLQFLDTHAKDKRVIYGRLAKKWKPIRNKKSKYYISTGQFSAAVFPSFTTGPAYVMTSDIVHELYERSLQQVYLKLEDVFTTGIVAQQLNVKRVHVNEFLNRRIAFNPCNIRKSISVHMIKANEQFDLWKKLLDQTTKCK